MRYLSIVSFVVLVALLAGCGTHLPFNPLGGIIEAETDVVFRPMMVPQAMRDAFAPDDPVYVYFNYEGSYLGLYGDIGDSLSFHVAVLTAHEYPVKFMIGNVPVWDGVYVRGIELHHLVRTDQASGSPATYGYNLEFALVEEGGEAVEVWQRDDTMDLLENVDIFYSGISGTLPEMYWSPADPLDPLLLQAGWSHGNDVRMDWDEVHQAWYREVRLPRDNDCNWVTVYEPTNWVVQTIGFYAETDAGLTELWHLLHIGSDLWHVFQYRFEGDIILNCGGDNRLGET
ncbi:MAG: hypothetical protein ABIB97_01560 [Patescibacteria group bacterium]